MHSTAVVGIGRQQHFPDFSFSANSCTSEPQQPRLPALFALHNDYWARSRTRRRCAANRRLRRRLRVERSPDAPEGVRGGAAGQDDAGAGVAGAQVQQRWLAAAASTSVLIGLSEVVPRHANGLHAEGCGPTVFQQAHGLD